MKQDETQQSLILNVQVTLKLGFLVYMESTCSHLLLRCGRISSEPGCGTSSQISQIVFGSIWICVCFFDDMYHVSCFDVVAVVIIVVVC